MKKALLRGLYFTLFVGGLSCLGVAAANAADTTSGEDGLLSGTQAGIGLEVPVDLSGNSISIIGDATSAVSEVVAPEPAPAAEAAPAAEPVAEPAPEVTTSGDDGIASGSQAVVDVTIPVDVSGNAISVLGDSEQSGATTEAAPAAAPVETAPVATTTGSDSLLGGTQGLVNIDIPVTVGGNAISVLGDSSSTGSSSESGEATAPAAPAAGTTASTTGEDGILSGTQVVPNVSAPVTLGGNAISVLGDSESSGSSTTSAPSGAGTTGTGASTTGQDSILGGTQVLGDVGAPVTLGGNAITLIGDAESTDSSTTAGSTGTGAGNGATTNGDDAVLGGTQVAPTVGAPVTLGGNAITLIGDAESTDSSTTAGSTGSGSTGSDGASTSGEDGILGGTQVIPVIGVPITGGGNAITVVGDPTTSGSTVTGGSTGGSTENTTSGEGGIGGGTQIIPVINLPIDLGGNAVTVIGDPTVVPTDPTDPVDPTDPTDPVDPTDPTDPGTPVTPGTPATPVTTPVTTLASVTGSGYSAAGNSDGSGTTGLALTGVDAAPTGGAIALLLLAGLVLLIASRKKGARI
jgi:hypothetical protein